MATCHSSHSRASRMPTPGHAMASQAVCSHFALCMDAHGLRRMRAAAGGRPYIIASGAGLRKDPYGERALAGLAATGPLGLGSVSTATLDAAHCYVLRSLAGCVMGGACMAAAHVLLQ